MNIASLESHRTYFLAGMLFTVLLPGAGYSASFIVNDESRITDIEEVTILPERPRVGLVLGGGGAKGAAHIGVLKVLEKYRVPVDSIAGTSMGAVIGALYAAGVSADEIEQIVRSIDWTTIFDDKTERRRINFRRKQEEFDFLTNLKLSFEDGKLILPEGLFRGQKLFIELSEHLANARTTNSFDDLPIPFRAITTDLEAGETVVIKDGDLATAVFASMAVPVVIPPVERDGLLLVDGGLTNNLPINVARSMGADILIVVDVGAGMQDREELDSFFAVLNQVILMLLVKNTENQLASLTNKDVLIKPMLGNMTSASFDRVIWAIKPGRQAAEAAAGKLGTLSLSEKKWHEHLTARNERAPEMPVIDFVEVQHDTRLSDEVVKRFVRAEPGTQLDLGMLKKDIADLYGLDSFERITWDVRTEDERTGLFVQATENKARRSYFRFGLLLETDFDSDANFELGASYTKRNVNRLGGEWRSIADIGSDLRFGTEFYQPFGSRLNFFINPVAILFRGNSLLFEGASIPIAEIRVNAAELGFDFGTQLGRWGELRVGEHRAWVEVKPRIGDPGFSKITFDDSFFMARFDVDTLDQLGFPRYGSFLRAEWTDHHSALNGDFSFNEFQLKGLAVKSWGEHTLQLGSKFQTAINADAGSLAGFSLGGFLNLSGFNINQLSGRHIVYGQAVYYRRLSGPSMFFDIPIYIGGSLEAGNVYDDLGSLTFKSLIWSSSVFVGVDSVLGPIYAGGGMTEDGDGAVYFFLGQTF